jgi:hypothetical protein
MIRWREGFDDQIYMMVIVSPRKGRGEGLRRV